VVRHRRQYYQRLRSASQPLHRWERNGATFETETPFELINADTTLMSFALQDAKCDQRAGEMMLLSPLGTRLTAGQPELILADADDFLNLGADPIQSAHLGSRQ
jgi:hypothetical protein